MKLVNPAPGFAPERRRKNRNASNISSNVARYQTTCVPRNNGFVVGELYESIVRFLVLKDLFWNFCSPLSCLGQSDSDSLFTTFYFLAASTALELSMLEFPHHLFYFFLRFRPILSS